jgi:hypothetical protein
VPANEIVNETADIDQLIARNAALLAACKFAHSVIKANGVYAPREITAMAKLEAAIDLTREGRS